MQGPCSGRAPGLEAAHHLSPNTLSQQWNRWEWGYSVSVRWAVRSPHVSSSSGNCSASAPAQHRCFVAVRDTARTRDIDLKNVRLLGDARAVVDDPTVSILIEAIGGADPATALIESALRAGKSVVTANKAVIA